MVNGALGPKVRVGFGPRLLDLWQSGLNTHDLVQEGLPKLGWAFSAEPSVPPKSRKTTRIRFMLEAIDFGLWPESGVSSPYSARGIRRVGYLKEEVNHALP